MEWLLLVPLAAGVLVLAQQLGTAVLTRGNQRTALARLPRPTWLRAALNGLRFARPTKPRGQIQRDSVFLCPSVSVQHFDVEEGVTPEHVRKMTAQLKAWDIRYGADGVAELALCAFQRILRMQGPPNMTKDMAVELGRATAKLGAVAAYTLHDAGRLAQMQRVNRQVLHLARRCGDTRTELFALQHASMIHAFAQQPELGIQAADQALEGPLPSNMRTVFMLRKARALSRMSFDAASRLWSEAAATFEDDDPAWWWVDPPMIASSRAIISAETGRWEKAAAGYLGALQVTPAGQIKRLHTFRSRLLEAQAHLDTQDALRTISRLRDDVQRIRSPLADRYCSRGAELIADNRGFSPETRDLARALLIDLKRIRRAARGVDRNLSI